MKNLNIKILAVVGLLGLAILNSCSLNCIHGSGTEVSETRKVTDFTKLKISGGYKIILKQDSSLSLTITGDDNLLKYIKTDVDDNELIIESKNHKSFCTKKAVEIIIGIKNLEQIKGSGAIEVNSDGKLNVKDLTMKFSGASKTDMDLTAANLNTEGSGATEVALKGQATSHTISLTGSGKLTALDFVVGKYDIETTGATECKINVLNELNVHTTGASNIEYRGNPATINNSKTGASTLKKID